MFPRFPLENCNFLSLDEKLLIHINVHVTVASGQKNIETHQCAAPVLSASCHVQIQGTNAENIFNLRLHSLIENSSQQQSVRSGD